MCCVHLGRYFPLQLFLLSILAGKKSGEFSGVFFFQLSVRVKATRASLKGYVLFSLLIKSDPGEVYSERDIQRFVFVEANRRQ